jgi:hypothetical protein
VANHEELNASHGEFVPASGGKARLTRLPKGELERRIRDVCNDWWNGDDTSGVLTTVAIRRAVEVKFSRPVSDNGVDACLRRWGRIGAAEIGEAPISFEGWTEAASTEGFKALYAVDAAHRAAVTAAALEVDTAAPEPAEAQYEPVADHESAEWGDAEARRVDG